MFGSSAAIAGPSKPDGPPTALAKLVPADQWARMRAQDKARDAASQIRWALERDPAPGFTGIELHEGSVRLWYRGTPDARVMAAVDAARGTAKVEVLPAAHALAELQAASDRMVAHIRANPDGSAHRVSIPVDGSGLLVGIDQATVGPLAHLVPDVGVPVRVVGQKRVRQHGRHNDVPLFWGGAAIVAEDTGAGCTAGFGVWHNNQRHLLTAGHCGRPGPVWYNGDWSRRIGPAVAENVGNDLLLIAADAGNSIYTGVGTSPASARVYDWGWVFTGEELCSSGSVTTWLCGHVVEDAGNSTVCGRDSYNNFECYGGLVWSEQEDGWLASRPGDSGGPVVLPTSRGLMAKGTIVGGDDEDHLFFQDFGTAWQIWGIFPIV